MLDGRNIHVIEHGLQISLKRFALLMEDKWAAEAFGRDGDIEELVEE